MNALVILDKHGIVWRPEDNPVVHAQGPHSIAVTGGPTISWFIKNKPPGYGCFFIKMSGKLRPCQVMNLDKYKEALEQSGDT